MANKKVFTDESLSTLINETKSYVDSAVSTKANSSHSHAISDVTDLQTTLYEISEKANEASVFVVTINEIYNNSFTINKTFDEIMEAYDSGKNIILYHPNGYRYAFLSGVFFEEEPFNFSFVYNDITTNGCFGYNYYISSDGQNSYYTIEYDASEQYVHGLNTSSNQFVGAINEVHALANTQSDWAQEDSTQIDYIKNKPDAEAALELSIELGLIEPTVAEDGSIYTDENGILYSL